MSLAKAASLNNLEASTAFAQDLAKQVLAQTDDVCLLFYGEMGSGKTTLIRELGLALGIQEKITSPTFIGMNEYHLKELSFYHYDAYQVGIDYESIAEILEDIEYKIIAIEWAENLDTGLLKILDAKTTVIKLFIQVSDETRLIELKK